MLGFFQKRDLSSVDWFELMVCFVVGLIEGQGKAEDEVVGVCESTDVFLGILIEARASSDAFNNCSRSRSLAVFTFFDLWVTEGEILWDELARSC